MCNKKKGRKQSLTRFFLKNGITNMMIDGITYKQQEIVLIPFPYSDLLSEKKRPVLILSNNKYNKYNEDIICCAITSNKRNYFNSISLKKDDIYSGKLHFESKIRPNRIFTLKQSRIIKKLGTIKIEKYNEVESTIIKVISKQKLQS